MGVLGTKEIRRPKLEGRKKLEGRNPSEKAKLAVRLSSFDLRILAFDLPLPALLVNRLNEALHVFVFFLGG
jgi:hypothetical protein